LRCNAKLGRISIQVYYRFTGKAHQRFQMTMRFETADKLAQMAKDLKSKQKPRRKK
jgi:hypothetical protein